MGRFVCISLQPKKSIRPCQRNRGAPCGIEKVGRRGAEEEKTRGAEPILSFLHEQFGVTEPQGRRLVSKVEQPIDDNFRTWTHLVRTFSRTQSTSTLSLAVTSSIDSKPADRTRRAAALDRFPSSSALSIKASKSIRSNLKSLADTYRLRGKTVTRMSR